MRSSAKKSLTIRISIVALVLVCAVALLRATALAAPPAAPPGQNQPLKVATRPVPPFVIVKPSGDLEGFSIDLWTAIAREMGREFTWVPVKTVTELLAEVQTKRSDVAMAALTINQEREKTVDFSYPFFKSGLGILTRPVTGSQNPVLDAIQMAFSPNLLRLFAFVFVLLIIVGHLVWLFERKRNPDFPQDYIHGIWAGIWWSAVTVCTIGYGDKVPRTAAGRVLGIFWMFAGLFVIANFTAGVTAQLAVRELRGQITGPQDLPGKSVVTVAGSTSDRWLSSQGIAHSTVNVISEAYPQLDSGKVQAIVYDYPVLRYYSNNDGREKTRLAPGPFEPEDYGIAMPTGSPLRKEINAALLKIIETGEYNTIYTKWFGVDPPAQ